MRARIRTRDAGVGFGATPVYFVEVKRWWQLEWRRVSQVTEYADAYRIALEYVAPQFTEVVPGAYMQRAKASLSAAAGSVVGAGTAHVAAQQGKNDSVNQYATGRSEPA